MTLDALLDWIPRLRAEGRTTIDVELGPAFDTIPAPPPSVREETKSDRVARAYGWIESPGEPQSFVDTYALANGGQR